jgi:hypothetical protein
MGKVFFHSENLFVFASFFPLESSSTPKNSEKKLKTYFDEYSKKEKVKYFYEEDWIKDINLDA